MKEGDTMSDFYDSATGKADLATDDLGFIAEGSSAKELFDLSKLTTKTIVQNGTYKASDDNADGFSEVTVNIPSSHPTLVGKLISQNGTYNASDDNADGYYQVIVNVQPELFPVTAEGVAAEGINLFTVQRSPRSYTYITGAFGSESATDTIVLSYPESYTLPSGNTYCVVYDTSGTTVYTASSIVRNTEAHTITITLSNSLESDSLNFISLTIRHT